MRDKFLLFVGEPIKRISDEESSVERGVVEASEKSLSHFEPELLGWARKCVHLEALCLWDGPPCPRVEGRFYKSRWGGV